MISYRSVDDFFRLRENAQKAGLAIRPRGFFYDPKNKRYDDRYRQRYLQIHERLDQDLLPLGEIDYKKALLVDALAFVTWIALHPIEVLKDYYRTYRWMSKLDR